MSQIESLNLRGPVAEAPPDPTRLERWFDRLGLVFVGLIYCLSIRFNWLRLPFLLIFPTVMPFAYFLHETRRLTELPKRKFIVQLIALHVSVLVGIILLWRKFPAIREPFWPGTVGALAVFVESIVGSVLLHFQRRTREQVN
jgi:hypothetical protein